MENLEKLTRHQLLHLLYAIMGKRKALETFKNVRKLQEERDMHCQGCIDIERTLSKL